MIKEHVRGTEEYRKNLCEKLDNIRKENKERFDLLMSQIIDEGKRREDHMKAIDDRLYKHKAEFLIATEVVNGRVTSLKSQASGIIFWGVTALISFSAAWGALTAVVAGNNHKWEVLEPEHKVIMQDIEILKEKVTNDAGLGMRKV